MAYSSKPYPKCRINQYFVHDGTFQATLWGLSAPSISGELKAPKIRLYGDSVEVIDFHVEV